MRINNVEMACKKSTSKYEYERHISIAQNGINFCKYFVKNISQLRVKKIMEDWNGDVKAWANHNNII